MTNRNHETRFFSLKSNRELNGIVIKVRPNNLEDITRHYEFTLVQTTAYGRSYESESRGDRSPIIGILVKEDGTVKMYKPKRTAYVTELTSAQARRLQEEAKNWGMMQLSAGVHETLALSQALGTSKYSHNY